MKSNQEKKNHSDKLSKKTEYQKYLEELEDPNYQGGSWALPENPTPLEQAKYEICQKVIRYKRNSKLTIKEFAKKIQLSQAEAEDILYCRLEHFTLDRLMDYTNKLFSPCEVKITIETIEKGKNAMPELFRFKEENFSEKDNETQWTYSINFEFIFNEQKIAEITITDHTWKKPGRETITKELILNIFKEKVNGKEMEPELKKNPNWKRDHFVSKRIPFGGKSYKLVFWFKDGADNHLWIKNCHQQD